MTSKHALVLANTDYTDSIFANLTAPFRDAEEFARVLKSPDICAFENVTTIINKPAHVVMEAIEDFFAHKKADDLLVLYFSGHGIRDDLGNLYLAVANTNHSRLHSTSINADFIRQEMDCSHSRKQILILDCCNSGAFMQGALKSTNTMGTASAFSGAGSRVILTATDTTQFAWEGDKLIGATQNSLFTHFLIEGLTGKADHDSDGKITVDELYDYVYEKVRIYTPKQTPSKFSYGAKNIFLCENLKHYASVAVSLPQDILKLLSSSNVQFRNSGIQGLEKLLDNDDVGLARAAEEKLREIATNDDSIKLRKIASDILENYRVSLVPLLSNDVVEFPTLRRSLRVFLCHASQDKADVREIFNHLKSQSWIDPWLDEEKLLPGQDWDSEIEKAVASSDIVIVCLSHNSINKEGVVQREIRQALDVADEKPEDTIFITPIRLADCPLPRRLKKWHYVDYFPENRKKQTYERLLNSLHLRAKSLKLINA